jgi:hypothetical protein
MRIVRAGAGRLRVCGRGRAIRKDSLPLRARTSAQAMQAEGGTYLSCILGPLDLLSRSTFSFLSLGLPARLTDASAGRRVFAATRGRTTGFSTFSSGAFPALIVSRSPLAATTNEGTAMLGSTRRGRRTLTGAGVFAAWTRTASATDDASLDARECVETAGEAIWRGYGDARECVRLRTRRGSATKCV